MTSPYPRFAAGSGASKNCEDRSGIRLLQRPKRNDFNKVMFKGGPLLLALKSCTNTSLYIVIMLEPSDCPWFQMVEKCCRSGCDL